MPKKSPAMPRLLAEPEALCEQSLPSTGTAVRLNVNAPEFKNKPAIVCCGPTPEKSGRVVVYVPDKRRYITVLESALLTVPVPKGAPWWICKPHDKFPTRFEAAVVHSSRVAKLLSAQGLPPAELVIVEPDDRAVRLNCHQNAQMLADAYNAKPVFGYSVLPSLCCQCVTFEAHSVLRLEDGRLKDITPDWDGEKAKFFVADDSFSFADLCKLIDQRGGNNTAPSPVLDTKGESVLRCGCKWCPAAAKKACARIDGAQMDPFLLFSSSTLRHMTREAAKKLIG